MNFLSRWNPGRLSNTRYEWQAIPEYGIALDTPHGKIMDEGLDCQAEQYAEVEPLTVCGSPKALDFSTETTLGEHPTTWKQIVDQLNHALNEWGLGPVQLTPRPN